MSAPTFENLNDRIRRIAREELEARLDRSLSYRRSALAEEAAQAYPSRSGHAHG
jgi:hypothetical protein